MIVTLTWSEMMQAHYVAGQRIAMNIKNGAQQRFGADNGRDSDALHLTACRGELAVAKALNLFWSGSLGDYQAVDVGGLVEVRAVNSKPGRRLSLIVHDDDKDDRPYVLADTGHAPAIDLRGWMLARDAKRREWWADPSGKNRPAYFVPIDALHPLETLKATLARAAA